MDKLSSEISILTYSSSFLGCDFLNFSISLLSLKFSLQVLFAKSVNTRITYRSHYHILDFFFRHIIKLKKVIHCSDCSPEENRVVSCCRTTNSIRESTLLSQLTFERRLNDDFFLATFPAPSLIAITIISFPPLHISLRYWLPKLMAVLLPTTKPLSILIMPKYSSSIWLSNTLVSYKEYIFIQLLFLSEPYEEMAVCLLPTYTP